MQYSNKGSSAASGPRERVNIRYNSSIPKALDKHNNANSGNAYANGNGNGNANSNYSAKGDKRHAMYRYMAAFKNWATVPLIGSVILSQKKLRIQAFLVISFTVAATITFSRILASFKAPASVIAPEELSLIPKEWNRTTTFYNTKPENRNGKGNGNGGRSRSTIFYNVYANPRNIALAESIVKEQISRLRPEHNNFVVRSIGYPIEVFGNNTNLTVVHHHDWEGDEPETLDLLWQHCNNEATHPSDQVVYMHSKGSFHPSEENDILRKFLTRGVLSEECENMPSTCNVCSSRMSPLPHPHTSGNMWVAKCEYIKKLIRPNDFKQKMYDYGIFMGIGDCMMNSTSACNGCGRYAAEHWVHSHPSVNPCDLSTSNFTWNYDGLPRNESEIMTLMPAPRFELKTYKKDPHPCGEREDTQAGVTLERRLSEYKFLYQDADVPSTWWGWSIWNP